MKLKEMLARPSGLCTSIACDDEENAIRIILIITSYVSGTNLQRSPRSADEWELSQDLPMDFATYRYRVAQ